MPHMPTLVKCKGLLSGCSVEFVYRPTSYDRRGCDGLYATGRLRVRWYAWPGFLIAALWRILTRGFEDD